MSFSTHIDPSVNGGVGVAFTDRHGGVSLPPFDSLNLGRADVDDPEHLAQNFGIVSDLIGVGCVAICSQVHGTHVVRVQCDPTCHPASPCHPASLCHPAAPCHPAEGRISAMDQTDQPRIPALPITTECGVADALVTTSVGVALAIRVADCVPVLLADMDARIVAAAHAGRVGLLAGILENTLAAMRALGATRIQAWIGPHICAACYEVPPDMADHAWARLPAARAVSSRGTSAIDLGAGTQSILESESVCVVRLDPCTSCDPRFFSHRRDNGQTGRQAGLIWLTTDKENG